MSPLRVVYDAQIFCAQQFGGISRYFASLTRELAATPDVAPAIVAPVHVNDYVGRLPAALVVGRKVANPGKARVLLGGASCLVGELVQYAMRPDLVHRTYYYPQVRLPRRARKVVSVYDMTYERFPENFRPDDPIPRWKAAAVKSADHVICISEHTRRDLLEMCDVAPERVSVTYLGYDSLASLPPEDPTTVRIRLCGADRPFILYVGSRTGCKNFPALVQAFAGSRSLLRDFTLVCFGGGAFTTAEQALIREAGATDCIRQASGPDASLANAYRHAELFVYPSLYEGFGIPPLEAMSLDCPVVCSNASSIPEVVGDAAVTFDPRAPEAMRAALEEVLGSVELRQRLRERGRVRKDLFSWQRCARETLQIYRKTIA